MQALLQALAGELGPGGGRVERVRRLSGGVSQDSWAFDLVAADGERRALVLRRAPPGSTARGSFSAGLVAEAELIALCARHGVPAPPLVLRLHPAHGLGEGFVTGWVEGETLGRRLVTDPRYADARRGLARRCGEVLACIHALPREQLPALRESDAASELRRVADTHRTHATTRPVFALALRWLTDHLPAHSHASALVHGDFRTGNLMIGEDGLRAVLDWELAHRGDPLQDLGWLCVPSWRYGALDRPVGGFGQLAELFAGYAGAGGTVDEARFRWWLVFGTLQWGVMCEGFAHAWLTGAEPRMEYAAIGRRACETEIDLLDLLESAP